MSVINGSADPRKHHLSARTWFISSLVELAQTNNASYCGLIVTRGVGSNPSYANQP